MTRGLILSCILAGLLAGCGLQQQAPAPPAARKNIEVNVPGANVNIDPDGGVKVQAPGVNVQAGDKGGVKVEAPNVNVNVNPPEKK